MNTVLARRSPTSRWLIAAQAVALGVVLTFAGRAPVEAQGSQADIVDTAAAAGNFTTLATALQAAGLVDTLKSEGPFTVFAPTDAAFAMLPAGTVEQLLADPDQLRAILTYHVVPGAVSAADVVNLTSATTVQGQPIQIAVMDGSVHVNQASVQAADVMARNGIIHVIDAVLLPSANAAS
jgi:uncharacterized surface protein with fasciclin (FAS1) repeats